MKRASLLFVLALASLVTFNGWVQRGVQAAFDAKQFDRVARFQAIGTRYGWVLEVTFALTGAAVILTAVRAWSVRFSWRVLVAVVLTTLALAIWAIAKLAEFPPARVF